MKYVIQGVVLLLVLVNSQAGISCSRMKVEPASPAPDSLMTLTCQTDVDVKQIAVEITGEAWNASHPNLYDDGSHGDRTKEDKVFSLSIQAPSVVGEYRLKFYRILPDHTELESTIKFSVK